VIDTTSPRISITFNEIMLINGISVTLREIETNRNIPLNHLNDAGFNFVFQPQQNLREFSSYQLIIHENTKDVAGNNLKEDLVVQFIVAPASN
jgi:hypothetical protein